jgi:hypothetical protein
MAQTFIILSPPRSFSSVACGMLGQHPQLYGVPELNLFVADTIAEWFEHHTQRLKRPQGTHGLLRTLAQLHDGEQNERSVQAAWAWLADRRSWSTARLLSYLEGRVAPKIIVDKSPMTVLRPDYIERMYRMLPDGQFLHLTRHPVPTAKSLGEILSSEARSDNELGSGLNPFELWCRAHDHILDLCSVLPTGQALRLKGEWLLEDPDCYLRQICQWLGIRDDNAAITAAKRPEQSPFACVGPPNARLGNDIKFLRSPELRSARFNMNAAETDPEVAQLSHDLRGRVVSLATELDYVG